jgi:predicted transcriptional regulator
MLAKKRKKFEKSLKSAKQMERHLKGISNHHRIKILLIIADNQGISLEDIIQNLGANSRTIGEHTRILHRVGLINKRNDNNFVRHELSPYGKLFVKFLKSFQKI